MSEHNPSRERELFEACLDLPLNERAEYLNEACAEADLRQRVEQLLRAYNLARDSSTLGLDEIAKEISHPIRIGPYRILQVLGEGGMGVVYEAEQTEPVRRRVAIKIIKLGMDTRQVVARFEAERQALAVMDHPYIAKVLDAGATEEGRPFFVMELVRGIPLPDYCDKQGLGTRERLQIFTLLCQAVLHAHQKGVIHRDLKPSNVLVTVDSDHAAPKVIDFGIAKAVGQPLTDSTIVTLHGQAIGTPAYMSPEQAGTGNTDIDTRADVYSLGVMLYELLVGALPIDPDEVGVQEFLTRLANQETDPPTPSARLATLLGRDSDAGKKPFVNPNALQRQLKGDLDWIIMKAIEKDRTRRYPTVNALIEDIRRYLAHETVAARPPTTAYRLNKFVRRNRVSVMAASVVFAALIAGGAGVSVGLVRAKRAEANAQREAMTATRVADFLVRLFEVSDPGESRGTTVTAKELLEVGATTIDKELGDEPAVKARMLGTLSRVHRSLGLYDDAATLAERSLEIQTDPTSRYETLSALGAAYSRQGEFDMAIDALEESLKIRKREAGVDAPETAQALHDLGIVHWQLNHLPEAREYVQQALRLREEHFGVDSLKAAGSLRGLAFVVADAEGDEEALPLYERSLRIFESNYGENHPLVADSLDSIGLTHVGLEDYDQAGDYHLRALAIRERVLGKEHPVIAFSMLNLGRMHVAKGEPKQALPYYERGVEIRESVLGVDHPRTADIVLSTAICHAMLGDLNKAQELMERSNRIYEDVYGPAHYDTFESRRNLGIAHVMQGNLQEALRYLRLAAESGQPDDMRLDDKSFDPLRDHPEFERLVAEVDAQMAAAARAKAPAQEARR